MSVIKYIEWSGMVSTFCASPGDSAGPFGRIGEIYGGGERQGLLPPNETLIA